ncbi:MAG: RnfH family protein [Pseudomonadaceae bacterium]|nr:RnfH family protein [Pseudomonadaceae bacterium]
MPTPTQASRKTVTVRYVARGRNFSKVLHVPAYQTLGWVVNASGVLALYPELAALQAAGGVKAGVGGKVLAADSVPEDGAVVDVYVPIDAAALPRVRALRAAGRLPAGDE